MNNWLVERLTTHLLWRICLAWEVSDPALSTPSPTPGAVCYLRRGYTRPKCRKQASVFLLYVQGPGVGDRGGAFCSVSTCSLRQSYTSPETTSWHHPVICPTVLSASQAVPGEHLNKPSAPNHCL